MVHPERFEPPTPAFGGQCSIQLSYGCVASNSSAGSRWTPALTLARQRATGTGVYGTKAPRPQLAPMRGPPPLLMTVMMSTEHSSLSEVA